VLKLAAALRVGERGDRCDWQAVIGHSPPAKIDHRQVLANVVEFWLGLGKPHPTFVDAKSRFELRLTSGNFNAPDQDLSWLGAAGELIIQGATLFAILGVQIAIAAAGGGELATCFACGALYIPARSPAPLRRSFCESCGIRAAWRYSKRAARDQKL
jgi:hypothetical protein